MKREGYQHGMVKTYAILSAPLSPQRKLRSLGGLSSAPTVGSFMRVPTKPTNHSKFTGKCGRPMCRECHINPASKSKDKAKGAQRFRASSDVVSDYRLITWRVVDARPGVKLSGLSATTILDYLDHHDECMAEEYLYDHDTSYGSMEDEGIVECEDEEDWCMESDFI